MTEVLSSRICRFHKAKCSMVLRGLDHFWAGKGVRIWYLISPVSEFRMSDSWPLFYFKRLLALLSSGNDRAEAPLDLIEPKLTFPCVPQPLGKNLSVPFPCEN